MIDKFNYLYRKPIFLHLYNNFNGMRTWPYFGSLPHFSKLTASPKKPRIAQQRKSRLSAVAQL